MLDFIRLERALEVHSSDKNLLFPPKLGAGLLKYNTPFSAASQAEHKTPFSFGAKEVKVVELELLRLIAVAVHEFVDV
jgi:hypothetical protein